MPKLTSIKQFALARLKALAAAAGVALGLLYQIEVVHPNHYVELAIATLTVLGVHQAPNLE